MLPDKARTLHRVARGAEDVGFFAHTISTGLTRAAASRKRSTPAHSTHWHVWKMKGRAACNPLPPSLTINCKAFPSRPRSSSNLLDHALELTAQLLGDIGSKNSFQSAKSSLRWPLPRTSSSRIRVYLLFALQSKVRLFFCSKLKFTQENLRGTKI